MESVEWARRVAERLLAESLPTRWAHTQGVARKARTIAHVLGDQADLVEAAAWLHDIGYAPNLAVTGFHPLDGARHLRDVEQADTLLCRLVARHSAADVEAEERGLDRELAREFPLDRHGNDGWPLAVLTYCDMTTDPLGRDVPVKQRLGEIFDRYESQDPVHRAISRSAPDIQRDAAHVTARIREALAERSTTLGATPKFDDLHRC